jgi:hypothetical protein
MRTLVAALLLTLGCAGAARAQNHENVVVTPIKDKAGTVIGAKFKMILKPSWADRVRVGLGRLKRDAAHQGNIDNNLHRALAAGLEPGYIRAQLGDFKVKPQTPEEVEAKVIYGEGNDLKPGDKVDVVAAFNNLTQHPGPNYGKHGYWHVWGMQDGPAHQNDASFVFTLPGQAPAAH